MINCFGLVYTHLQIMKSHPVTIRSEGNKKRRQVCYFLTNLAILPAPTIFNPQSISRLISVYWVPNLLFLFSFQAEHEVIQKIIPEQLPAKTKGKKEEPERTPATASEAKSSKPVAAPSKPMVIKALNVANVSLTKLQPPKVVAKAAPKDPEKEERERIRALAAAARLSAMGGAAAPQRQSKPIATPAVKQVKTLDEYMAERSVRNSSFGSGSRLERVSSTTSSLPSSSTPAINAWSRANSRGASFTNPLISAQSIDSTPGTPGRKSAMSQSPTLEESFLPGAAAAAVPAANPPTPQGVWGSVAKRPPLSEETTPRTVETDDAAPEQHNNLESHAAGSNGDLDHAHLATAEPIIPGMTLVVPESDSSKLTKAQRKNLKRAEKKAAARVEETTSVVSATPSHPDAASFENPSSRVSEQEFPLVDAAGNELHAEECPGMRRNDFVEVPSTQHFNSMGGDGGDDFLAFGQLDSADLDATSQCMRCIVQRKLQTQIADLVGLGFPSDAATTAVANCGGNLELAVMVLLGGESALPPGMGLGEAVDISEELAGMQYLQLQYNLVPGSIEAIVVDCDGDLTEVASHLQRRVWEEEADVHAMRDGTNGPQYGTAAGGPMSPSAARATTASTAHNAEQNGNSCNDMYSPGPFGLPSEIDWGQAATATAPIAMAPPTSTTTAAANGNSNGLNYSYGNDNSNSGGWNSLFGFDGASALSAVQDNSPFSSSPYTSGIGAPGAGAGASPHHGMPQQLSGNGNIPTRDQYIPTAQQAQQGHHPQQQHQSLFGGSFEALGFGTSPTYQQLEAQHAQHQQHSQQFAVSGSGGGSSLWSSGTAVNANGSFLGSPGGYNNNTSNFNMSMSNGNGNSYVSNDGNNFVGGGGHSYGMQHPQHAQQEMQYSNNGSLAPSSWSQPSHMDNNNNSLWTPLGPSMNGGVPGRGAVNGGHNFGSMEGQGVGNGSFPGSAAPQQQVGAVSGGVPGQNQYLMEDNQLNELMATLMCR